MYRRLDDQNHYEILEVSTDASAEEIQSAFDSAKEIYGHDALVTGTLLSERERRQTFELIAEAYQTLIAEESRRQYDERLGLVPRVSSERGSMPQDDASAPKIAPEASDDVSVAADAEHSGADEEPGEPGEPSPTVLPRPAEPRVCPIQLGAAEEATGEFLRRAREALGLDLTAIAEETKIGRSMLEYIETERHDRLPAPVYLRNFTRQVARCLGLDEDRVSRTYLERIERTRDDS